METTATLPKTSGKQITGASLLIELLVAEGVELIFGYPGGAIMPIYDAIYDYGDRLRHILVRHEQGATHAAEGYARRLGRAGVVFATSGPGATNLVTGIADAMMDSVPLVCITGQVPANLLGTDAFQETDIIGITTPITKWNYQVTSAAELWQVIPKAFEVAQMGRPGPVVIDITKNAQLEMIERRTTTTIRRPNPSPAISSERLRRAAELINSAKRPLLFVGHGVLIANAEQELAEFVEKTGIPVAATLLGLSAFPSKHPLYVGMLGMHGNYAPNVLCNHADLIIALGMRFDDRVTGKLKGYLRSAKIIHIDIDPAELDKIVKSSIAIKGDAKTALTQLLPLVSCQQHPHWLEEFRRAARLEMEKVIEHDLNPQRDAISMSEVVHKLSDLTGGDAVIVADVGQHQMATARYFRFKESNSFITSGGLGTMGFALPAAIGAKFATPEKQVVAVIGDGGFQMTLQELGIIMQEKLPVKIIILNNNYLGMVRQWQEMFFESRYSFVEMQNPDFVLLAKAYGIDATRISRRELITDALQQLLEFDGPCLLEIIVEREDKVFPMIPAGATVDEIRLE